MTKSKKWNLVTIYRDVGCENNFEINRKYQKIVEILSDYLQNDEEGNKRLYVPAVIAIKDGKIVGFDDETAWDTKGYETPDEYWENEDLAALKEKLRCMMRDCEKSICTSSCNK